MGNKFLDVSVVPTIKDKWPGRDICFVAVKSLSTDSFYVLGVVVKDEPGYTPLPWQLANGSEDDMQDNAEVLNDKALHLTQNQVDMFIASSMIGQR